MKLPQHVIKAYKMNSKCMHFVKTRYQLTATYTLQTAANTDTGY